MKNQDQLPCGDSLKGFFVDWLHVNGLKLYISSGECEVKIKGRRQMKLVIQILRQM